MSRKRKNHKPHLSRMDKFKLRTAEHWRQTTPRYTKYMMICLTATAILFVYPYLVNMTPWFAQAAYVAFETTRAFTAGFALLAFAGVILGRKAPQSA